MNRLRRIAAGIAALFRFLRPPRRWKLPVLLLLGVFAGLTAMILHISRATSYLTEDPAACVNCHIMAPQYASWQKGSHGRVATCNDCHVPENPVGKYAVKAYDGTRHAFLFTFRLEPHVIRMHPPGQRVVQGNCVRCHAELLETTVGRAGTAHGGDRRCWDCHREVPHGRVNSLASAPHARVPEPVPIRMPEWLEQRLSAREEPGADTGTPPPQQKPDSPP